MKAFERGNFELGAGIQAVAVTASAGAETSTAGSKRGRVDRRAKLR